MLVRTMVQRVVVEAVGRCFAAALSAAILVGSAHADQRVIVLLHGPRGAAVDGNAAIERNASIERKATRIYAKWRVVPGFAATVDDAELQRLREDPDVISIEPDLSGSVIPVSNEESIGLNEVGLNGVLI